MLGPQVSHETVPGDQDIQTPFYLYTGLYSTLKTALTLDLAIIFSRVVMWSESQSWG